MNAAKAAYYEKRANILVKNLKKRHFDAVYCKTAEEALKQALEWIAEDAVVGWGGATSAMEIGLLDAIRQGKYQAIDRERCKTPEEREQAARDCMFSDVFVTGANALISVNDASPFFDSPPITGASFSPTLSEPYTDRW